MTKIMRKIWYFLGFTIGLMTFFQTNMSSMAQQSAAPTIQPATVDIRQILLPIFPLVEVEYQSGSIIVLKVDENTLLISNGTMSPFWNAIDIVKHYSYTLNEVTTSGMGSQGNPTRFFAIMTKP